MKILGILSKEKSKELRNSIEKLYLELNKYGWGRDQGYHLEARFGYSYSGNIYKEIVARDNQNTPLVWISDIPDWILELKNKYYPEANSVLVFKGEKPETDTSTSWHKDIGAFKEKVVLISLGESSFEIYKEETQELKEGDILEFNSSKLHRGTQISTLRYTITFRETKNTY